MLMHCDIALNVLALFAYELRQCALYVALHYWIKFTYLPTYGKMKKLTSRVGTRNVSTDSEWGSRVIG